jgi:hypothetical protein
MLNVGDRVVFCDMFEKELEGSVTRVVKWSRGAKEGCTYYVKFTDDSVGEFRSDDVQLKTSGERNHVSTRIA